jgi:hypothetical protein
VARAKASKSGRASYPSEDVPFIFFDDLSAVTGNRNTAKVYLYRNRPSLGESTSTRSDVIAELGMGVSTFAQMTLQFYGTLKSMIDDGTFHPEILKLIQNDLAKIESRKTRRIGSIMQKGKI